MSKPNLNVEVCGVKFKNPLIAASGTYGFGREFNKLYDIATLGGISVKGLTLKPRLGNPPSRIAETPMGMLNSVGLQNPGVDAFIAEELPWLRQRDLAVIANIAGSTVDDYCQMAEKFQNQPVEMLELNISCPNVKEGGVAFGTRPESILEITRQVKRHAMQPLMVKLSPNVADIGEAALAAQEGGADAISLINTLTGMAVDVHKRRPILANVTGGLSGPAVKPVALRMVYQASHKVKIPVVGMGGIMTGEDVAAFMLCGASAVMVGTANLADPVACPRILREFEEYLARAKVSRASDLVGKLEV
ncbi:dihydroorotate dehydrogenase [Christensenellaceae bacterium NSJ-44]|uniref:Dihydroorotate dehydrogenase n=1 Tax=Luoshenia tenuis TaxID=2763654 RepID=A0A926CZ50_9FIRM|nr:dihydroorotate dehydrogenase [Luoshenia tenuis]MBC8528773.1 dihydroorotate dehydrogenase [Luoshenia tenuis]